LIAARKIEKNLQKWVVKKHVSQVGELDQIKLKSITDDRDEEIYMIQPVGFAVVILFQLIINLSEARLDELHVI